MNRNLGRHRGSQTPRTVLAALLGLLMAGVSAAGAGEPAASDSSQESSPMFSDIARAGNLPLKTLGGRQFWGDRLFCHGWRIQENVLTGHCRLLDPHDVRQAAGGYDDCLAALQRIREERNLPPMSGKAVIFLHGIIRSSKSFARMAGRLKELGYTCIGFDYPSTQVDIAASADYLHQVISHLEEIEQIDFVVHSMGGLVTRAYLSQHGDDRIRRIVMMGVPNRGAEMADHLRKNLLYRAVFGPAGQQLVSDAEGFIAGLPCPKCEFGIIAGGKGNDRGFNPLIPGDDDGTVTVASAKLPGAADFLLVHCLHSFLMLHEPAIDAAIRFLETGAFRESGEKHPIPAEAETPTASSAGPPG